MVTSKYGKMIRKGMIDHDMSTKDLAKALGTSPRYLGFIIEGRRSPGKYDRPIKAILAPISSNNNTTH